MFGGLIGGIGRIVGGMIPGGNSGGMVGNAAEGMGKANMAQGDAMAMKGLKDAEAMGDKAGALGDAKNALDFKLAIQQMVQAMIRAAIQAIPKQ